MDHIDSLENLCDEVEFCQEPTVEYMKKEIMVSLAPKP